MTTVLEVRGLSAGYGPLRVLHEIDLAVGEGERVGLVGLNGHGKTTLLRSIMGLVDWRQGEVELDGASILKTPTHRLARAGVVMIPQGDALFPGLSVQDNLDSGAFATGWRERKKRRDRVLELFPRLAERLDQAAGTLSGGERRMCSVGRGLMSNARIYLIDEPSLGLAPGVAAGLYATLRELDLEGGSLVLAEQNQTLLEGWIGRVARIHGGRIVSIETAEASPGGEAAADRERRAGT
ncbi:MAG: ATP-binding cassette domain-containing protein [Thermoleophilia bacterium]|nr:ATP-binding cassette domain-containing protein [Thermoleophilia bacterium]